MAKSIASMSIKPLHDFVLVAPVEGVDKTPSGIILPDSVKEKPQVGEIKAVGPGAYDAEGEHIIPMVVKVGQKVLYKKWGGNEVKVGQEEWMLIEQKDIMAIVE